MGGVDRIGDFAEKIGRSVCTVRRWEPEGRITARRSGCGRCFYDESDVRAVQTPGALWISRKTVVHCRVSLAMQGIDLGSQDAAMEQFCVARGLAVRSFSCRLCGLARYERQFRSAGLAGAPW